VGALALLPALPRINAHMQRRTAVVPSAREEYQTIECNLAMQETQDLIPLYYERSRGGNGAAASDAGVYIPEDVRWLDTSAEAAQHHLDQTGYMPTEVRLLLHVLTMEQFAALPRLAAGTGMPLSE
jgi:hypothetical protein